MPEFCAAYGCKNARGKAECEKKNISFHKFPLNNSIRLNEWLTALKLKRENFQPNHHSVLCSDHFREEDFEIFTPSNKRRVLKRNALPSKFTHRTPKLKRTSYSEFGVYQKTVKKTAMKTSSATNTIEQGYKSKDLPLTSIQSGNLPLSNINLVMLAKNTTSDCRFTTENIIPTAVASRSILKKNVKSTDNSWDSSNLDSAMNHTEFMNCNFNESEQIDCVTHEEAFCAAKTLLHYMINQDDVNNEDINFILNLTKKIESKLSIKKKTSS